MSGWAKKMEEERLLLIEGIENEIRKAMLKTKEDYNIGVIDGLIIAIKLIEG